MISDPLADALTKVRNAYRAGHKQVVVNHNNLIENIIKILAEENFINSYQVNERNPEIKKSRKTVTLYLRYTNTGDPVLTGVQKYQLLEDVFMLTHKICHLFSIIPA